MRYSIFDPTGNITALVETPVPVPEQPACAAAILRRHPEVEQVGFVRFTDKAQLRMAGGEFCGNAAMSAAALWALQSAPEEETAVALRVSGVGTPVTVELKRTSEAGFDACVRMPEALSVAETDFSFSGVRAALPLVRLRGISHIVIEQTSPFFALLSDKKAAGEAVRQWCAELRADGLGLMFLTQDGAQAQLKPLVYVPAVGTVFWENACASGSSAVGMALSRREGGPVRLALRQPGGTLRVEADPGGGTRICGATRRTGEYVL